MKSTITAGPARAAPTKGINRDATKWRQPPQTELLILWAIRGSGKHGVYGLDIQRAISECSGGNESISVGSLYSLLKRLRKKGYVDSREGDALGGGAKRQYYFLTKEGQALLRSVDKFFSTLQAWKP